MLRRKSLSRFVKFASCRGNKSAEATFSIQLHPSLRRPRRAPHIKGFAMLTEPLASQSGKTHLDIYDSQQRSTMASRLGVSEDRLKRAVRLVGSRITTLKSYLER
jgi:hypothetical protein